MNKPHPTRHKQTLIAVKSFNGRQMLQSSIWRITSVVIALTATVCLLLGPAAPLGAADTQQAQPTLPSIDILIDGKPMTVEVAASGEQRYMGLSFRESMPENQGMLFVYDAERPLTFTMRNTLIPLSIAFISKDLVINEIHDMNVGPGQLFDARQVAQYALEVNQGWFARNGIEPGAHIVKQ